MFRTPVQNQAIFAGVTDRGGLTKDVGKQKTRNAATDYRQSPGTTSTGSEAGFGNNGGKSDEH